MSEDDGSKSDGDFRPTGMKGFTVVWAGQLVSLLGSAMTGFGIMIWLWQTTGRATPFALYGFFWAVPAIIAGPLAGALVDRWDRKLTIALSDITAGISTVVILILYSSGNLEVWHLYATGAFAGFFGAFQFPAFSAAITMMVSKENYSRASAMRSIAQTASGIFAPVIAASLLFMAGLKIILMIDIITFIAAVSVLFFVYIPKPPVTEEGKEGMGTIWKEAIYGFKYVKKRASLFNLLLFFLVVNLVLSFSLILRAPMILARTGNNEFALATVNSIFGAGGLIGGLVVSIWGGPKRKIRGFFYSVFLFSMGGVFLFGIGRGIIIWSIAGFIITAFGVVSQTCVDSFWQSKVAPDVQGRVFSARAMIAGAAAPFSMLIAGPLADNFFEPGMKEGGVLRPIFSWLVGTGDGSGISVMFVITGVLSFIAGLIFYSMRTVREAEDILPDHDATGSPEK